MPYFAAAQALVTALLPFLAFGASYFLQRPGPDQAQRNMLISAASILVAAIFSAVLQGQLTGDPVKDTAYVITMATTLQIETFGRLQRFLRENVPQSQPAESVPPPAPSPAQKDTPQP